MDKIQRKAYGKINLGLDVIRKRPDGYHDLNMIMQTVNVYDDIIIEKTNWIIDIEKRNYFNFIMFFELNKYFIWNNSNKNLNIIVTRADIFIYIKIYEFFIHL